MSFTIPNEAAAFHPNQAEPDAVDIDILVAALNGQGVVSGAAVTAQGSPDMTAAIAVGVVRINGVSVAVASGNVNVGAADGTNPRFDLITVNDSGTKACTAGTAAAEPVFPAIPANSVVLAAVYVPASDTDIDANQITDKRCIVDAHSNVQHMNRTRYIPVFLGWNRRTATYPALATDAHGSLNSSVRGVHWDEADGNASYKIMDSQGIIVPADFVSGMKICFAWSSSAAGNNAVFGIAADSLVDAGTVTTSNLAVTSSVLAAPAVANTLIVTEIALTTDPIAGAVLFIEVSAATNHASDSNTGTRSVWGVWLEYEADM